MDEPRFELRSAGCKPAILPDYTIRPTPLLGFEPRWQDRQSCRITRLPQSGKGISRDLNPN